MSEELSFQEHQAIASLMNLEQDEEQEVEQEEEQEVEQEEEQEVEQEEEQEVLSLSEQADLLMDLKAKIKELEAKAKAITANLTQAADNERLLPTELAGVYQFNNVKMSLVARTVWAYSPAVKLLQEQEIISGEAIGSMSSYYKFTLIKKA